MNNYNIKRFTEAHKWNFDRALKEIQQGKKRTHWMWYIFPQLAGLGQSRTSQYYGIVDLEEARLFLADSYLGKNLIEITGQLLLSPDSYADNILGSDAVKLQSSMTLFYIASGSDIFKKVLDKFFKGQPDARTIEMLNK